MPGRLQWDLLPLGAPKRFQGCQTHQGRGFATVPQETLPDCRVLPPLNALVPRQQMTYQTTVGLCPVRTAEEVPQRCGMVICFL
jgi:hypothetical protein